MRLLKITVLSITFVVLLCAWGYYADPGRSVLRFRETGYNNHFTTPLTTTFEEYIQQQQHMIQSARAAAHVPATHTIIDENAPVAFYPAATCKTNNGKYAKGILLIHGLFDSPYPMQQLGQFFQHNCFVVYVILLPGHGTVPGDLLHTTYTDWVDATHYGAVKLAEKAQHIYLGGFSLGGLLAVNEALDNPHLQGLFLFAPALKLGTPLAPLVPSFYWTSRVVKRMQWWALEPDSGEARYESIPINPVYQIRALMNNVRVKLKDKPIDIPIFVEESAQDKTVDTHVLLHFFNNNHNPHSQLLWYFEHGVLPLFSDRRIQPIHSELPTQNILSMSHLSFTLSPSDPIYGKNGSYKDCLNYQPHSHAWQVCEWGGADLYYGEMTEEDLKTHIIRRLTFNPFYGYLTTRMIDFVHAVDQ